MTEQLGVTIIVMHNGAGLFFVAEGDKVVIFHKTPEMGKDDPLIRLGEANVEHIAFVGREIEQKIGHVLPEYLLKKD